jgi:hypothetical protein
MALQLNDRSSSIRRRHRRTRVRVNFSTGATSLRGAISIHVERISYVDSMVPQR